MWCLFWKHLDMVESEFVSEKNIMKRYSAMCDEVMMMILAEDTSYSLCECVWCVFVCVCSVKMKLTLWACKHSHSHMPFIQCTSCVKAKLLWLAQEDMLLCRVLLDPGFTWIVLLGVVGWEAHEVVCFLSMNVSIFQWMPTASFYAKEPMCARAIRTKSKIRIKECTT